MILLVRHELAKLYRRATPYVVYAAIMALVALVILGFKLSPPRFLSTAPEGAGYEVMGSPLNGLLICQFMLKTLARLLLPFLAPIVTGEILGAEGAMGTLRTLLVRPRTRSAIWVAKFITAGIYTVSLAAVTMLTSLVLGSLVFGWGKLWEFSALRDGRVVVLTEAEALLWLTIAYLLLALAVFVTASLGFMLGSFVDNGLIPGFAALGIVITLYITMTLPFEWVETISPYLFVEYLGNAADLVPTEFDPETQALRAPMKDIVALVRICLAYIAAFGWLGWWRFQRRDVTC